MIGLGSYENHEDYLTKNLLLEFGPFKISGHRSAKVIVMCAICIHQN